jgi:hypothetical protein
MRPSHGRVSVVLNVKAVTEEFSDGGMEHCVGFLIDKSGSMSNEFGGAKQTRMDVARTAVLKAIEGLKPGTVFFVIAYDAQAQLVLPPQTFENMDKVTNLKRLQSLAPGFNTRLSSPMKMAYRIFDDHPNHLCHAVFLTDGKNQADDEVLVDEILKERGDSIPFYTRGIGDEWEPATLKKIAEATLGDAAAMPDYHSDVMEDFLNIIRRSAARMTKNVRMFLGLPKTVRMVSLMQTSPTNQDLMDKVIPVQGGISVSLGAWGAEERDYLAEFELSPLPVGQQLMVCRPSILVGNGDTPFRSQPVVVEWTSDASLHAYIDGVVAHYRGEAEKSREIEEGLKAMAAGDMDAATKRLGRATKLASESGDMETLERISRVIDVIDPTKGTVRIRQGQATKASIMDLEVSSTRTVRAKKDSHEENRGSSA